jgi:hypothetical protein
MYAICTRGWAVDSVTEYFLQVRINSSGTALTNVNIFGWRVKKKQSRALSKVIIQTCLAWMSEHIDTDCARFVVTSKEKNKCLLSIV